MLLKHAREYVSQMNASIGDKRNLIPYIVGNNVMDVGCGGGALMAALLQEKSNKHFFVYGLDKDIAPASQELHNLVYKDGITDTEAFELIQGDASRLHNYVNSGEVDTFIFSSILHEVFSYGGFNINLVKDSLRRAFNLLPVGGRIIIRDGIKSEDNEPVQLKFSNPNDLSSLKTFASDFKGREINFHETGMDSVELSINDCMEFLYTWTWGTHHYEREVQEQYGILSTFEYLNLFDTLFGNSHRVVSFNNYLQEGYNHYLSKKVSLKSLDGYPRKLPDSNAIFVIEKTQGSSPPFRKETVHGKDYCQI